MKKLILAAITVLMCAAGFAGCAIIGNNPHTEHDYKYEYIDKDNHKITCSGCDLDETGAHDFKYEYIDENTHKKTCTLCNKSETLAHDFKYEFIDETGHKITCSHCAELNETTEHNYKYEAIDADTHSVTCPDCDGINKTLAHDYKYEYIDETGHKKICTACNKNESLAHDYEYEYVDKNTHKRECGTCDTTETVKHDFEYEKIDETTHKTTCSHCSELNETDEHEYADETDLSCDACGNIRDWYELTSSDDKDIITAGGYVKENITDFSQYEGTPAYRTVATADELIAAIKEAKYDYTNNWDDDTQTYTQTLNSEGTVHVIEITQDLNLGYNVLSNSARNSGIVENFASKYNNLKDWLYFSDMFLENGISQIKVENISNLLIYSKNGAKITHAGFKLTSDTNVVFRNLEFDEMWQWEDAPVKTSGKIGDYDWFGWAYFKIAFCGYIWIDHCTFGKSYDGQIDYSNPVYDANAGTAFRAPYGATGPNGLHISWCKFNAGSDDENGYLYKMMAKIEQDYQDGKNNCLYYKALRDGGISFEDILYGIAIPQKKGFLCGDSGNGKEDYDYNLPLQISFANCTFKNLEDRLPKLRGGNAYMYNCIVDSTEYMTYRTKLRSAGAASKISAINSGWKCALVSQGIVCGNGGSFKAENCIFKGIETLLKNNDGGGTTEGDKVRPVSAGYQLVNCIYQKTESSVPTTTDFTNGSASILKTDNFEWHTETGDAPFEVDGLDLDELESILNHPWYGAGTTVVMQDKLLNSKYDA